MNIGVLTDSENLFHQLKCSARNLYKGWFESTGKHSPSNIIEIACCRAANLAPKTSQAWGARIAIRSPRRSLRCNDFLNFVVKFRIDENRENRYLPFAFQHTRWYPHIRGVWLSLTSLMIHIQLFLEQLLGITKKGYDIHTNWVNWLTDLASTLFLAFSRSASVHESRLTGLTGQGEVFNSSREEIIIASLT